MSHADKTNRLARESSPYLRQHAHNPVDWHPWGEEALTLAREEGKPIFLSIGYAACHWCHVMERESFEDPRVASFLAEHFVSIKVDREERPDIDAVYMEAVQALTGSGGWPLSVFLTPERAPFFGGTYFPPEPRWGMPSFLDMLSEVADAWRDRRDDVEASAATIATRLARFQSRPRRGTVAAVEQSRRALEVLDRAHDARHGGFGEAPKFPTPSRLFFLLRRAGTGDAQALAMLSLTLDRMAAGGMWDWAGGGFHRYSVDTDWLVPHFEKMLYDNALLARLYGEAGIILDRPDWVEIARRTADYLITEMQGPEGGFYSSTDADSEGEEGIFFTWTADEVRAALPAEDAELVVAFFGLEGTPNFEDRFILRPQISLAELAARAGTGIEQAAPLAERLRRQLYEARGRRARPGLDDKRLAGWNGMAITALASLGSSLDERRFLEAAQRCGRFVLGELLGEDGRVVRSHRDGHKTGAETLEDVAWLAAALVELYQSDGGAAWLEAALRLLDARLPHYTNEHGDVFDTPDDGEALPVRPRTAFDGATPASVAVLAEALLRLGTLTGRKDLIAAARRAVASEAGSIVRSPESCTSLLEVALALETPPLEVVVVGDPDWDSTRDLLRAARRSPRPITALAPASEVPVPAAMVELVPLFAGREQPADGRAIAYICEGGACRMPTEDPVQLAVALGER